VSDKLSTLASKDFIESKFKEIITEKILSKKLKEVQSAIKAEVQKELENVNKRLKEVMDTVKTQEVIIEELRNKVSDLETKTETLGKQNETTVNKCEKLKEILYEREAKINSLDRRNNDLEQYSRRNNIRIYGLKDEKKETYFDTCQKVLSLMNDKLGIKLRNGDVDIAHRIGKFSRDGNRPVICKFVQRFAKHDIIRSRRKLKGTHYVIREDLTNINAKLLENVASHSKVKVAWSDEGKIIALLTNNNKYVVSQLSDLDKVSVEPVETPSSTTETSMNTQL
jgi:exosome complex exonuclease DIS3/RRP44